MPLRWLYSRRLYAGVVIGLAPLVLIACDREDMGQASEAPRERVVVRTYDECPSRAAAARTGAVLESMPPNGVLVETFAGCCRADCGAP